MKRIILLIPIILFLGLQAFAQKNNLVVFSESGERFVLVLNGLRQNTEPATNVKVVDLNQPNYVLKIIYEDKKIPDLDKKFTFLNPGNEVVLAVKMKKGVRKLTYISEAPIKDNLSEPNQKLIVYGAPAADTVITTTTTTTTTQSAPDVNSGTTTTNTNNTSTTNVSNTGTTGISINVNENGMTVKGTGMDVNVNTTGMNTSVKEETKTTSNSGNTNSTKVAAQDNSARYIGNGTMCASSSMSQEQLIKLKYEIDQRSLVTKMKVAQEAIQKNCMLSHQVADLVKLFDYESDQLELAKFSYKHTYDTKNYDVVVNALSHDFNKPKLVDFVGTSGGSIGTTTSSSNASSTTTTTTVTEKKVVSTPTSVAATASGCSSAMPDADFKTAKASIGSKSFEDSKLTMAKQVMKNKCLKTSQVKEIMDLFSFEETKLSFAKEAYSYTMDKDNYYLLNDAFSFETSIEDLNKYIESKK